MSTSIIVRTDLSGTSFVLDVTALELNSSLSILDFEVTHNGTPNASYTKTSPTQLTYTGVSVTLGTKIIARRVTSVVQSETTFLSTTTATALTNALEKERLRIDELDARLSYTLAQVTLGGISIGSIPISNTAYGVSWDNDTTNAPSKNATYDKFAAIDVTTSLLAPLASPVLTGNPTAPTATVADNDTSIATTAFVKSGFKVFQAVLASANVQGNNVNVNTFSTSCALGADVYRFAVVRFDYSVSGFGKSLAFATIELRDNASTVIQTTNAPINNASYLDNTSPNGIRFLSGTFTGNYSFSFWAKINAAVTTDVYSLQGIKIEVLFIA